MNALDEPLTRLTAVNQLFYDNTDGSSYATLFFAEYDAPQQRLRFANCGHLPALLLRHEGAMERLNSTSTVLGLFREWECISEQTVFQAGDLLVLYTDGLSEATDEAGEEFGEERLIEAIRRHRGLGSAELVARLVEAVRNFSQHEQEDDITLIVAKVGDQR